MDNKELDIYMNMYEEMFGDKYPLFLFVDTPEKTIKRIKNCLGASKPVEELYNIDYSDGREI